MRQLAEVLRLAASKKHAEVRRLPAWFGRAKVLRLTTSPRLKVFIKHAEVQKHHTHADVTS